MNTGDDHASPLAGETVVIHGRQVVPGVAEGAALVTREPISGWGGVDPRTGTIVEVRHELRGQSFAGKVLVFPGAKGSSGWSAQFHLARVMGTAPAAWLFNQMTTKVALGAVVSHAPAMTDFDIDLEFQGHPGRPRPRAGLLRVFRWPRGFTSSKDRKS